MTHPPVITEVPAITILGTPLQCINYESLTRGLLALQPVKSAITVDFANTQIVTLRRHEPEFERLTRETEFFLPDGMPLVWAMNQRGAELSDRVYGPAFTRHFLETCPGEVSHYLIGGSDECGKMFVTNLTAANSNLQFLGGYHGPCSSDGILADDDKVMADLIRLKPTYVWVGLGTPKQYRWIKRARARGIQTIFLAVGFAFDVIAGTKRDAPVWMQRNGLTWLFRLASEPARLGRRYLKYNSLFLWYFTMDFLGGRKAVTPD